MITTITLHESGKIEANSGMAFKDCVQVSLSDAVVAGMEVALERIDGCGYVSRVFHAMESGIDELSFEQLDECQRQIGIVSSNI